MRVPLSSTSILLTAPSHCSTSFCTASISFLPATVRSDLFAGEVDREAHAVAIDEEHGHVAQLRDVDARLQPAGDRLGKRFIGVE